MPGSSFLYGPLACSNARYIFPDKPKTVTLDAEVYLGRDDNDSVSVMLAVLHYFIPLGAIVPDEDSLYLVGGKIASITSNTPVGDGYDTATYDIEIEAVFLHPLPNTVTPARPMVTLAGSSGKKVSDREFIVDTTQFVSGENRLATHTCLFPSNNKRFANPPIPRPNSSICVIGSFYSDVTPDKSGVKRLPLEINEIAFIGSDAAAATPIKGKPSKSMWGDSLPSSGPSTATKSPRKRPRPAEDDEDGNSSPTARVARRLTGKPSAAASTSANTQKPHVSSKAKGKRPARDDSEARSTTLSQPPSSVEIVESVPTRTRSTRRTNRK